MSLLRTKSIERSIADTETSEHALKKNLSALDLVVFGVGVIVGAGIFTLTGKAAQSMAGPAIVVSFVLAAICCGLAALCYAEFASTVPVSGSAYTFSYASLGELIAWIIGWDLLLELMLGSSVVAQGWGSYFATFLQQLGLDVPSSVSVGGLEVNWAAMLLVAVLTVLIVLGIKESLRVNLVLVALKLFVVIFVIVAGAMLVDVANWSPFVPPAQPTSGADGGVWHQPLLQALIGQHPTAFGAAGIVSGAALVFFAYIGFDVVATTSEEARNPKRDLPIGIIGSLVICTILYCAVALVITGMVRYDHINPEASLANAFVDRGQPIFATVIAAGAVAGLTTVVLTLMIGATRVLFAMSRDRLLPPGLAAVHPRFRTPWIVTLIVGVLVMLVAGLTPIGELEEMVNIGTLSAFLLVSVGVIVLRRTRPDLERGFRVPLVPVVPILSVLICGYLMLNLALDTWLRFAVWLAIGIVIYAGYGYWRSKARAEERGEAEPAGVSEG